MTGDGDEQPPPAGPPRRLAASTLGAPGVALRTVLAQIAAAGGTGVELRAGTDQPVRTTLTAGQRSAVVAQLAEYGITPVAVASYVKIAAGGPDRPVLAELEENLRLAADLGAGRVRVFPGAQDAAGEPAGSVAPQPAVDRRAAGRLAEIAPLATDLGVQVVLETHDSHPRGADVARVLALVDRLAPGHRVGVIWDVLHPWRSGEPPADTLARLAPWLLDGRGYVQLKDVASPADLRPVPPGSGAVPLQEILASLDQAGYADWLSLEWERAWYPDIAELPIPLAATATLLARP